MGRAGESQNITHQAKKMNEEALLIFRDRFDVPLSDEDAQAAKFYRPRADSPEMRLLRESRERLGGSLPARRSEAPSLEVPPLAGLRGAAQGHRRAADLDDDGLRAGPRHRHPRQAGRPPRGADRGRRVADVRHGGHVPPARDLLPGRPALLARGLRAAHVLPGGQEGADPPGGHHRGRRAVVVDRRGHLVRHQRRPDDPVLHLLLDVRVPADRRPDLGRRRPALPRVPDRRHLRPHHPQRRGPAARGRPQPRGGGDGAELPRLRPHVRPRARRDHAGRHAADGHRPGGRLLLPDGDERELLPARAAGGRGGGDHPRHAPRPARGRATGRACS